MKEVLRSAAVPAYILLCIVLGGSTQGVFFNLTLQLLGVVIILWAVTVGRRRALAAPAKSLFLLVGLVVLLFLFQLIPLPPWAWSTLPGREHLAEGFRQLAVPLPWLPLSLAPYETMATALTLIPPIAVISAMLLADAYRPTWISAAVLLGTFAAVLFGALQVSSANPLTSPWYLYRQSSFGFASGFFANSNHMGALLAISVPLLFAWIRQLRDGAKGPRTASAALILALAGILVLGVGVALNGSLAVLLLGLPVATISATILMSQGMRLRTPLVVTGLVSAGAMSLAYFTSLADKLIQTNAASFESRQQIWSTTYSAIVDHFPIGSGIGSFRDLYPRYEDPSTVTATVVNHAHNDYLELALETGAPGMLLLLFFFFWWSGRTYSLWSRTVTIYSQAAAIASGTLLLHSVVDYPLRTAALSAVMAACLAIMAQPRRLNVTAAEDLWPTRHLEM